MIKWCKSCVLSDSRPNIYINIDGECNACKNHKKKKKFNWSKGEIKLSRLFKSIKKKRRSYDCLIPVSGGKDSTWQTVTCLRYGLKPLAITYKSPGRNKSGSDNLNNLISLGVDHIDFTLNPKIEKHFMLKSFKKKGATAIPMHFLIYNLPYKFAQLFNIPLIIWGENPAKEYGFLKAKDLKLDNSSFWKKHGALSNTMLHNWHDSTLSAQNLSIVALEKKNKARSIFLSDYIEWDPVKVKKIAQKKGFKFPGKVKTGIYDFADIDCDFISIHHYLKWYKFGITRAFDNLSIEIRNGRISRNKALELLKHSLKFKRPNSDIVKFSNYIGISIKRFNSICEKFRNKKIWKKKGNTWKIENFILKNYNWK